MNTEWYDTSIQLPTEGQEVIGYNEKWIHPDFNPEGTRVCFMTIDNFNGLKDYNWTSAKWDNDQDSWHTHAKWCCDDNGGTDFEPTHWTPKPIFNQVISFDRR